MTKVFIVAIVASAQVAIAADAPRQSVSEKASAKILQAFPYEPPQVDSNAGPNPIVETNPAVVLPKVIVQGHKPLVLRPEEVLSRAELAALIRKKYPGASLKGQDPLHYEGGLPNYGALLYAEDKRVSMLKELTDFSAALREAGDVAGSKKLHKLIQEASIRSPDALMEAMDKSANNSRR